MDCFCFFLIAFMPSTEMLSRLALSTRLLDGVGKRLLFSIPFPPHKLLLPPTDQNIGEGRYSRRPRLHFGAR